MRKKYNLNKNDFCVSHVSTLPYNGDIRYGPYTASDKSIFEFNEKLIKKVYSNLRRKKVIFKDYPSKRFLFQPTLKNIFPEESKKIFFEQDGDWRYIRAVSDLIVTMSPTSTFTWCIGADVPIVWINLPWAKFRNSEYVKNFKKSFIYIDANEVNWERGLHKILLNSPNKILDIWKAKQGFRENF